MKDFPLDSVSEKADLKKNDIILSLDGFNIEAIDDIKIFLLDKKQGDTIKVRVLRKRFLLGKRDGTQCDYLAILSCREPSLSRISLIRCATL
ncbi:MAG: PDZ domain-containing protein [Nitrospirota bacterium]